MIGQAGGMCHGAIRLRFPWAACIAVVVALSTAVRVNGQTVFYDLTADWSGINNPNGPWRIYKAPGQLFTISQADYFNNGTNQVAWADETIGLNAHVPVWMKTSSADAFGTGFASVGTIVMHTAETARTGTELSSVTWTSPGSGTAVVSGGAWVQKVFDRPQVWEILVNGASVTSGTLTLADPYNQATPFDFINGSGGASVLNVAVNTNDVIELLFHRQSTATPGTPVGMTFGVAFTAIPEVPWSALAMALIALVVPKFARGSAPPVALSASSHKR